MMERKTIVFLVPHAPPLDFLQKYFVREMGKSDFRVLYWDVGPVMGYDLRVKSNSNDSIMDYTRVHNLHELRTLLKRENRLGTVFVPQITPSLESLQVYRQLARLEAKTVFFGRGYLPLISEPKQHRTYVLRKLISSCDKMSTLRVVGRSLLFRLHPGIKRHSIVFTAGRLAERVHAHDTAAQVPIHHFDIDRVLTDSRDSPHEHADCCVFLDDYLPFHPDFGVDNAATIDPNAYYAALNVCFDSIEKDMGCPIVIAAHPKADYVNNPFGGRPIVAGQTHNLVRDARLVLAHASTAVSLAVIFEKPLCLLYSEEIRAAHYSLYALMVKTSEMLGSPLIDFTRRDSFAHMRPAVDRSKYAEYRKEFLSNSDDPRLSSEIVISAIDRLIDEAAPPRRR